MSDRDRSSVYAAMNEMEAALDKIQALLAPDPPASHQRAYLAGRALVSAIRDHFKRQGPAGEAEHAGMKEAVGCYGEAVACYREAAEQACKGRDRLAKEVEVLNRRIAGLSSKEAGAVLHVSPGAVRVRLFRARARLRKEQ